MQSKKEKSTITNATVLNLVGFGISREVFLNGERLLPDKSRQLLSYSDSFNWSYKAQSPTQLALAILLEIMPEKDAIAYHKTFLATVIAILPEGDFNVRIEIGKWLELVSSKKPAIIYAQDLITFKARDSYFPLFLNFGNILYKEAVFAKGSREFELLDYLDEDQYAELKSWTEKTTEHLDTEGRKVYTELCWNEITQSFMIINGVGIGYFEGHQTIC